MTAAVLTELAQLVDAVRSLPVAGDTRSQVEQIRLLEDLSCAVAATQSRVTARFAVARTAELETLVDPAGLLSARGRAAQAERDIAGQVGLAKRVSPFHARRFVERAALLTGQLPNTFTALTAGQISEWRAAIVARETSWLSPDDRAAVDSEVAGRLAGLGNQRIETLVRSIAYRLDPDGFMTRIRGAEADRRVTLRPAPDAMTRLSALLPVAQGVAAWAALTRHADTTTAAGDHRGRGQIMADALVQRVTGQTTANDVPLTVNLIMTDRTLLAPTGTPDRDDPALLDGHGPIPGPLARQLITTASTDTPIWLRRLFTAPDTGELITMETRRRLFTPGQREFTRLRDHTCRTPYCDAPIRETDHTRPTTRGGSTTLTNAQGLCKNCNLTKQSPGWTATPHGGETITTTPTGHHYRSRAPDPPGKRPGPRRDRDANSVAELRGAVAG